MKLSREFKVGLFMVVSLTLLYFGFNFLKGIDFFTTSNKYYAIFQNIDKLTESNQVYLNGVAVGRVSDIQIQQRKDRVIVALDIDSDIILTDSSIALLNGELLGGRFIQLDVGRGGRVLKAKDTLRSEVAKGVMDFAEPVATNLQTTLGNLNTILAGLARNTSRLDTMFIRLQETPSEINRTVATANREMVELSDTFKGVAGNLNGRLDELQPTLANFKTLSDSLKAMEINGTLKKVQETLANLNKTISLLSNGDNTMSKLMTEDSLYVNLNALLLTLDTLADHFNTNPKHFLSPLGKSRSKIERDLRKQEDD
jgi:phospholipid/cholesterol/gamma-HCH transport system substrate-binding protein